MPTTKDHALLVLDVDETLIYGTDPCAVPPEPRPPRVDFTTCNRFLVMKRPYVDEFLRWCFASTIFHIAVWSASGPGHVWGVLNHLLLPHERAQLVFVWDASRTGYRIRFPDEWDGDGNRFDQIKNLVKVRRRGYDLNRVLALDDNPHAWRNSYGNIVRIRPFLGDDRDEEILRVQPFIERWFQDPRGVRKIEKRWW